MPPLDRGALPSTELRDVAILSSATDPRSLATISVSWGGKECAEPLFPPFFPLRMPVPFAAVIPCRLRRGKPQPEPRSAALISQVDCMCCKHPLELDLIPDRGRTAKIGHRRRSAATGAELRRPSAAPFAPKRREPPDLQPRAEIRSCTLRSEP
jgi:hypothetical protein